MKKSKQQIPTTTPALMSNMARFKDIVLPYYEDVNTYNETYYVPYRQMGKSTIIKDLGLTLKALGYPVYIVTNNNGTEYYADDRFFTSEIETRMKGVPFGKKVFVLVDDISESELNRVKKAMGGNTTNYFGFINKNSREEM